MQAGAYLPFALALMAEGSIAAGKGGDALDTLARAIDVGDASGERFYAAELHRLRAEALRAVGRPDDAARAVQSAIDIAARQGATLFERRGRALAAQWHLDATRVKPDGDASGNGSRATRGAT
jgi:hypothetical protein